MQRSQQLQLQQPPEPPTPLSLSMPTCCDVRLGLAPGAAKAKAAPNPILALGYDDGCVLLHPVVLPAYASPSGGAADTSQTYEQQLRVLAEHAGLWA
jgi:hypothetical protein